MVLFPNCKINIGLNVTSKRADGYHDIATIFYPLRWCDAVEAIPVANSKRPDPDAAPAQFTCTGLPIPGVAGDNICLKAYLLLKKDFPELRQWRCLQIHSHRGRPRRRVFRRSIYIASAQSKIPAQAVHRTAYTICITVRQRLSFFYYQPTLLCHRPRGTNNTAFSRSFRLFFFDRVSRHSYLNRMGLFPAGACLSFHGSYRHRTAAC